MKKYAICGALLSLVVLGAYYSGYAVGSRNVKIEYKTKEVEVIKYVEKEKGKIYSSPNAVPSDIIRLFNDGKL
jgi:hypothetical protein